MLKHLIWVDLILSVGALERRPKPRYRANRWIRQTAPVFPCCGGRRRPCARVRPVRRRLFPPMATRLCSRAVTLLIRRPEIRIVRTLEFPREYPKRPPYVPWTGYLALCVPAYFAWQTIYWEAAATDVVTQQMIDVSSSLEEVIDLPTE